MRPRAMIEVPQHLKGRDFTRIGSWSSDELKAVLDVADTLKAAQRAREPHELLPGRTLGMIFQKPSTRTRVSFEVGIAAARGPRPLPGGQRPPAGPGRDDPRHRHRPLALPRRDHDPHLRAGRRRAAGRGFRHPGDQRAHGLRTPVSGARRPDDDSREAGPPLRDPPGLSRRRQQRVRLADGRGRPLRDALRRGDARRATSPTAQR